MNSDDLIRTQRWMQAVITNPAGIRAGIASEDARQNIDIEFGELEQVVSRSRALIGAERLMIYSRAYHLRLLECFRAEFPCLLHALGQDLFNHFVIEYLRTYPSQSYTLHDLAKDFPRFLADTRPDAQAPPDEREEWPDFIIELATFERAFIETYDGPGVEGRAIMSSDQIPEIPSERFSQMRLVAVPCLRLFGFRYPILAYFNAVRAKKAPSLPAPSASYLAMNRKGYRVRFIELSFTQYNALRSLTDGLPVAEALIRTAEATGQDAESLAMELRKWLRNWVEVGFFVFEDSKLR